MPVCLLAVEPAKAHGRGRFAKPRPFKDGSFPDAAIAGPIATHTGGTPTSASTEARRSGSTPVATASSRWLSAT